MESCRSTDIALCTAKIAQWALHFYSKKSLYDQRRTVCRENLKMRIKSDFIPDFEAQNIGTTIDKVKDKKQQNFFLSLYDYLQFFS